MIFLRATSLYTRRIAISAIFLSIALVLRLIFSWYLPLFGANGIRVGLSPIFSMMPAILFGPVYGAIVAALSDVLGFLLRPSGPYLPFITLAVTVGGFIRGALWLVLRGKSSERMRIGIAVLAVFLLVFGLVNIAFLQADGIDSRFFDRVEDPQAVDVSNMHGISRLLITRSAGAANPADTLQTLLVSVTTGLIGSAAFGFVLLGADFILSKRFAKEGKESRIMPLLITVLASGLIVSTLNTIVLRETIFREAWQLLPFVVVWLPRVIETIVSHTVYVYFMALLLGIFERQQGLRELIR